MTTGFLRDGIEAPAACLTQAASLDRGLCRHEALIRFSAQRMVAEHLDLYDQLVAAGRPVLQHHRGRRAEPAQ